MTRIRGFCADDANNADMIPSLRGGVAADEAIYGKNIRNINKYLCQKAKK